MQRTTHLDLPYILPSQAQKHVTHNEAIRALDAIVQLGAIDRDRTSPPDSPQDGDRHLIAAGASGDWQSRDGDIAAWQDGAWMFYSPLPGWLAWIEAEQVLLAFDGGGWSFAGGRMARFDSISVNGAVADSTNRLAINAPAALFNHAGSGHRLVINRAEATDTASILFQTGFSGRAEFGLAGDNAWRVKLSADGNHWTEAIAAHPGGSILLGLPLRLQGSSLSELPDPAEAGPGALIYVSNASGGPVPAYSDGTAWRRIADDAAIS